MKKGINAVITAMLFCIGCNREADPVKYTEDVANGLRKTVSLGQLEYTIQYKPAAYIASLEHLGKKEFNDRKKQLEGTAWFNVSFRIKGYAQSPLRYNIRDMEEYVQRQDYYLNAAPRDMYVLYGRDTLYVTSYWFENNQNLAAHETMVIGFALPESVDRPREDLRFSFYDRVYKNGIIKAIIKKENLADMPDL